MTTLDDTIWRHAKDHPDYYVNRLGDVFSKRQSEKGHYLTKRIFHGDKTYDKARNYVKLFKGFAGSRECDWIAVDHLVASAFVNNPDPEKFTYVTHLDGNFKNDNASNLKWGLPERKGNIDARKPIRAINTVTNEILNFDSCALAASYLDCDPSFISHHLRKDKTGANLYQKTWRFEYVDPLDDKPKENIQHSIPVIALNMKTNEEVICDSGLQLARKIGISTWMVSVYRDTEKLAKGEWLIESYNKTTEKTEKKEEKTMSYIPVPTSKKEEPKVVNPLIPSKQTDEFQKAMDTVAKIQATKTLAKTKPVIDPDEICKKMTNGLYNLPPQDTDSAALNGWMLGYADCMNIVIEALKEVKK